MAHHSSDPSAPATISEQLRPVWPWLALGLGAVVAGGLLAAVVAHAPTQKPVWASAFLVLVVGVGQIGLALGRTLLATRTVAASSVTLEFLTLGLGNAGVLIGTLIDSVWVVDVGGALLLVALVLMIRGVRSAAGVTIQRSRGTLWLLWCYRALIAVLVLSIPVGLLLARG